MFNTVVNVILKFVVYIFSFIADIMLLPVTNLINALIPNLSTSYINTMEYFFNTYVFPGIKFSKQVFLNVTHFNPELIGITITLFTGIFASLAIIHGVQIFVNLWRFFRKGE